jgi:hypothetical protein
LPIPWKLNRERNHRLTWSAVPRNRAARHSADIAAGTEADWS